MSDFDERINPKQSFDLDLSSRVSIFYTPWLGFDTREPPLWKHSDSVSIPKTRKRLFFYTEILLFLL